MQTIYDAQFKSISHLDGKIYENCTFESCDFASQDWSNIKFIDCSFDSCNLSLIKVLNTAFQTVKFNDCKMVGLHFEQANKLGFEIQAKASNLEASCFYQIALKGSNFDTCNLRAVDFSEANLEGVKLINCDLLEAVFDRTGLFKTDFRGSMNVLLDPERNKLKAAHFNSYQLAGLLTKYNLKLVD